jgi:hypothetical protein
MSHDEQNQSKRCRKYSKSYLNCGFSVIDDDVKCYLLKV